ncbi:MAG: tRNA (adenosine(37)-N6)-dimethylallyltransferase MiaA [Bacteroidia bacterium]|jgi:tRNA dimethylallyltransferase|nr:tRNA (adenosine(37)-N6)-dimethylallyltransferase MiaA [Bacteroidia bacterium]
MNYEIIVLLGPTASGKTKLAVQLANQFGSGIISADSRQVYKQLNIGTGKDLTEYSLNNKAIPYHLIDIAEVGEKYHVHQFMQDFNYCFSIYKQQQLVPILCGGTGLYLSAILQVYTYTSVPMDDGLRQQLQAENHSKLINIFNQLPITAYNKVADLSTVKRTIRAIEINTWLQHNRINDIAVKKFNHIIFGLNPTTEKRRKLITERLHERWKNGLADEVAQLMQQGISYEVMQYYGLEYKFVSDYVVGKCNAEETLTKLNHAIHQFAKRQMTYFRKMEKDGLRIYWLPDELSLSEQGAWITHQLNLKNK